MAWLELPKTWHDTNVEYCDVCGNLLIRRAWVFESPDGRTLRACRESDERLHARLRGARSRDRGRQERIRREPEEGSPPVTGAEAEPRAPFAPSWSLDALIEEALAGLEHGEAGDAKRIDGRALAVKASPMKGNSEHIVTGMAALPPGFTTRAHSHAAEEVAVFLRGSGRVDIDGVPHRVEAGTVLVTPSDLVHVTHSDPGEEPLVVLWFYAPPGSEARWVEPERHETAGHAG